MEDKIHSVPGVPVFPARSLDSLENGKLSVKDLRKFLETKETVYTTKIMTGSRAMNFAQRKNARAPI